MRRTIDQILKQWGDSRVRQPLLVRGARQVGKTYSVTNFGRTVFENTVSVNFEEQPELSRCFSDLDPKGIIDRLSILTRMPISPGRTLLFLDEIQECPKAITALRYFFEKLPELHIIGAGSLIEFAMRAEDFRMPVGRVQSMYMYPMSFGEFLKAVGEERLLDHIHTVDLQTGMEQVFATRLEQLFRQYLLIGGMPRVVDAFKNKVLMEEIQRLQSGLIRTYTDDFAKYASTAKHKYLKEVYYSAPQMAGRRYKYSHVNPGIEAKFLKEALGLLCDARCIFKICHASGAGVPLSSTINERKFKIAFLDVGLMQNALGVQGSIILDNSIMQINAGSVAEQYVAQELFACVDPYSDKKLHFWAREARGSNAEVDFLIEIEGMPIPVEVKAGTRGSLKSMRLFLKEYPKTPLGVRYSMHELSYFDQILSIPLYMVNETQRLVQSCIK
ncbi:MAG: AAA family ATPase [Deltaproteobacteria bacterium]|nr:AAA family ATPase [Deltaproteobacteria bacterium]